MTQQICDRLRDFETENQMLTAARTLVQQARQAEDMAFKRFSGKDFASDDLKKEDALEDKYMSTAQGILNGLLYLPESEPLRRKAELAKQVFKDFQFSLSSHKEAGQIRFRILGQSGYRQYSLTAHRWQPCEGVTLTPEEKQVLTLSAQGYTMKEISDHICRSFDTVKFYRRQLFEKLDVANITEAIAFATNYGLL